MVPLSYKEIDMARRIEEVWGIAASALFKKLLLESTSPEERKRWAQISAEQFGNDPYIEQQGYS